MREEVPTAKRVRPVSPNIQIYRPQLTSVLSIANRITGVVMSVFAVLLVVWLTAAAAGPQAYARFHLLIGSWFGQAMLLASTLAFFVHLCGGIMALGLQVVIEDYIHSRAKIPLLVAMRLGCFVLATAGIVATLRVALGS